MYKLYILGNGGYAQECFEQFVLCGTVKDFGGFIVLKNDKAVLMNEEGVTDFDKYAIDPEAKLVSDFFVDDNPEDWIQA